MDNIHSLNWDSIPTFCTCKKQCWKSFKPDCKPYPNNWITEPCKYWSVYSLFIITHLVIRVLVNYYSLIVAYLLVFCHSIILYVHCSRTQSSPVGCLRIRIPTSPQLFPAASPLVLGPVLRWRFDSDSFAMQLELVRWPFEKPFYRVPDPVQRRRFHSESFPKETELVRWRLVKPQRKLC